MIVAQEAKAQEVLAKTKATDGVGESYGLVTINVVNDAPAAEGAEVVFVYQANSEAAAAPQYPGPSSHPPSAG